MDRFIVNLQIDKQGLPKFEVMDLLTGTKNKNFNSVSDAKANANWRNTENFTQKAKSGHLQDEDY